MKVRILQGLHKFRKVMSNANSFDTSQKSFWSGGGWWSMLNKFPFPGFILTIKVIERRPNKMRMRLIIFRFLSTIFWFILSSLTPAALSGSLLPSYSVSSSSLKWNLWSLFNNLLNLRVFLLFYRDSALVRIE